MGRAVRSFPKGSRPGIPAIGWYSGPLCFLPRKSNCAMGFLFLFFAYRPEDEKKEKPGENSLFPYYYKFSSRKNTILIVDKPFFLCYHNFCCEDDACWKRQWCVSQQVRSFRWSNRSPDTVGVRGCDTNHQAQKSDHIHGRMAQLVVPTGTFVGSRMVAWLSW